MTLSVYISGQRSFGAAIATLTASSGYHLTGIASPPATRDGQPDRLALTAERLRIPWTDSGRLTPGSIPPGTDVILAAHSHAFIGARTRARATLAAIGYHPSLLPLHRGRDAVRWTARDGDRVAGGTVYHLTATVDGGPIAAQDYVIIPPGITARDLWHDHLFPLGLHLTGRVLADLASGLVVCVPQDDALATWEPSWDRPPLHRPELPELPSGRADVRYTADPARLRRLARPFSEHMEHRTPQEVPDAGTPPHGRANRD